MAFPPAQDDMQMDEEVAPDDEAAILQELIALADRAAAMKQKERKKPAPMPMPKEEIPEEG